MSVLSLFLTDRRLPNQHMYNLLGTDYYTY